MSSTEKRSSLSISRRFTTPDEHPYDGVQWQRRDSRLVDQRTGETSFEQLRVEVPADWSQNATNILAQKYFSGALGSPERETSLRQVADRVADSIGAWGLEAAYFSSAEEEAAFVDELKHIIVTQKAAFNSPVWFNIGVEGVRQQASACFILSVEDEIDSIMKWYCEEAKVFQRGSGAGVNLSKIRGSQEEISGGGHASGPVTFMRGADASAGTIKSGGTTRRAAKMVVLDCDHPDVEEFIWCKAIEERKSRDLQAAGWDMAFNGDAAFSIQYQNANNSVRLTDDFMRAVADDAEWAMTARTTGEVVKTIPARDLLRQIAKAAWECADPGVQFTTTINDWHTAPNHGPITSSNPCSEYLHVDNSACNLASINLLHFVGTDGTFDVEGYKHTVEVMFVAQDILVGASEYPTDKITENTLAFRQLGLGYANLGASLMCMGLPYDSDEARAWCGAITALTTGHAYAMSTKLAERLGAFEGYAENAVPMRSVLAMHQAGLVNVDVISDSQSAVLEAAKKSWMQAVRRSVKHGVRNAQATVLAPTGTIGLLMDCDTTGIEPDFALVKYKSLSDGSSMAIVNGSVSRALRALGYSSEAADVISEHISQNGSVDGAPGFDSAHADVFACAVGYRAIGHMGHVEMMAAAQPFLSGAISKTINCPPEATPEDIEKIIVRAWELKLKAVAIYRDGSKVYQPLQKISNDVAEVADSTAGSPPKREELPRKRNSVTSKFVVAGMTGYLTVGEYGDGRPGELFLRVSKQGSTLSGFMDQLAVSVSHGLQYGVPVSQFIKQFTDSKFEPAGMTDDPDFRLASSILDYVGRRLALDFLTTEDRHALSIFTSAERTAMLEDSEATDAPLPVSAPSALLAGDGPVCSNCGNLTVRSGSCHVCTSCGTTTGCS